MTAALPTIETLLRHQEWVRALARSLVADPSRADDVAQQTMLEAMERPPKDLSRPKGWLATVARNTARALASQDRRRKHREQAVARNEEVDADPADFAQRAAAHKQVVDAVFALQEPYRSVVLLRYFEDSDAHQIAAQLKRPVATVRTQLQRGLERMRQRLDRDFGDRRSWCTALLPLLAKKHAVVSVPVLSSVGALVMWKWTVPVILAIASLFFVMPLLESLAEPTPPSMAPPAVAVVAAVPDAPAKPTEPPREVVAENVAPANVAAPTEAPLVGSRCRLLTLEGQPLAAVAVEYVGANWPRLSGGQIAMGSYRQSLTDAQFAELRSSQDAMNAFANRFAPFAAEAAALLRGEPVASPRTVTDQDGRFALPGQESLQAGDLRIGNADWLVYGSGWAEGSDEQLFLAGPGVPVAGRVVDGTGQGLQASVLFYCNSERLPGLAQELARHGEGLRRQAEVSSDGYFDLGMVPRLTGLQIRARHRDQGHAEVLVTDVSGPLLLVVKESKQAGPRLLSGVVYRADGSPAAGANVIFGQATCKADQGGRFALRVRSFDYQSDSALQAYLVGQQAAIEANFGARFAAGDQPEMVLRLGGAPLAISGRVVDAAGVGQAGVRVLLGDGTPKGIQLSYLEAEVAGWPAYPAFTDAKGHFQLTGLQQRTYVVRAINLETLLVIASSPVMAGTTDLVLAPAAEPFFASLTGEVVDRTGEGIAGVKVRISTELERGQNGYGLVSREEGAETDQDGRFVLHNCPRQHVCLDVVGEEVVGQRFEIEAQATPCRLQLKRQLRFRIRSYGGFVGSRFSVYDNAGKQLAFDELGVAARTYGFSFVIPTADSPVYKVSEDAATLGIIGPYRSVMHVPLALRTGVLNEIDL